MKRCSKCKKDKTLDSFNKCRNKLQSHCKICLHEYYLLNKKRIIAKARSYNITHPEMNRAVNKNWLKKNPLYYQKRHQDKSANDPLYRISRNLRSRTSQIFKHNDLKKKTHTIKILGTTFHTAAKHLETQFKPGMTWENYGKKGWEIDHKIPLASAKTEIELRVLCHYTNLQPLWGIDNQRKGCKI